MLCRVSASGMLLVCILLSTGKPCLAAERRNRVMETLQSRSLEEGEQLVGRWQQRLQEFRLRQLQQLERLQADARTAGAGQDDLARIEAAIQHVNQDVYRVEIPPVLDPALVLPWNSALPDLPLVRRTLAEIRDADGLTIAFARSWLDCELIRKPRSPELHQQIAAFLDAIQEPVVQYLQRIQGDRTRHSPAARAFKSEMVGIRDRNRDPDRPTDWLDLLSNDIGDAIEFGSIPADPLAFVAFIDRLRQELAHINRETQEQP